VNYTGSECIFRGRKKVSDKKAPASLTGKPEIELPHHEKKNQRNAGVNKGKKAIMKDKRKS